MKLFLEGRVRVRRLRAGEGGILVPSDEWVNHNLVTYAGQDWVALRMKDATEDVMSHLALGTGSTEPHLTDTDLANEVFRDALVSTTVNTSNSPPTIT